MFFYRIKTKNEGNKNVNLLMYSKGVSDLEMCMNGLFCDPGRSCENLKKNMAKLFVWKTNSIFHIFLEEQNTPYTFLNLRHF